MVYKTVNSELPYNGVTVRAVDAQASGGIRTGGWFARPEIGHDYFTANQEGWQK